ncbi:MAG: hypothetical protein AAGA18_07725 [Verrucomicrobiota bacterium]
MKNSITWILLVTAGLVSTTTNAQVTIGNSGGGSSSSANWTVTANPLSVAGNPGTPSATGTLTNAAAGDSFSYVISGVNNWDLTANPANFDAYKGNLTSASTIKFSGNNGVGVGNNKLDVLGEGIVYTFDTTGLTASGNQLLLNQVNFNLGTNSGDKMDFVFWDSDTNTIVDSQYNLKPNASYAPATPITVTTGDQLYVAVGAGNSNNWRVKALVLDIEAGASGSSFDALTVNNTDDPVNPVPVVTLTYDEPGGAAEVYLETTQDNATYYWLEDADHPEGAELKMQLDANNVLTLVDPTNPTNDVIVLNPNPANPSIQLNGVDVLTQSSADSQYLSSSISISSGTGVDSVTIGTNNTASGNSSLAFGQSNTAAGYLATTYGFNNNASNTFATAYGFSNIAGGLASTTYGEFVSAQGYAQFAMGRHNIPQGDPNVWVDTDDLLIIGNGTDSANPSNAFVVRKNGDTEVGKDLALLGNEVSIGLFEDPSNPGTYSPISKIEVENSGIRNTMKSTHYSPSIGSSSAYWEWIHKKTSNPDNESHFMSLAGFGSTTYLSIGGDLDNYEQGDIVLISGSSSPSIQMDNGIIIMADGPTGVSFSQKSVILSGSGINAPSGDNMVVVGEYNDDSSSEPVTLVVGNGSDDANRSNSFVVYKSGKAEFTGPVHVPRAGDIPMFGE